MSFFLTEIFRVLSVERLAEIPEPRLTALSVALARVAPARDVGSTAFAFPFPFPLPSYGAGLAVKVEALVRALADIVGSLVLERLLAPLESRFKAVLFRPQVVQPHEEALEPCSTGSGERVHVALARLEQQVSRTSS